MTDDASAIPLGTIRDARLSLSYLARHLRSLIELDAALERIGGIEIAAVASEREATRRLARLRQQEDDAKQTAARVVAEAERAANALRDDSVQSANALRDEARENVGRKQLEAQNHERIITLHQETLRDLEASIAARTGEHEELVGKIAQAHGEHERIKQMITDLKARW